MLKDRIVVGYFKGLNVIAAVETKKYPWVSEFHLIPKSENIDLYKVSDYLNSDIVKNYIKAAYKNFVKHPTRTILLNLPLII